MVSSKSEMVDWKDLTFPSPIYKYRTWTDEFHKNIIFKRQVYMAPPKGFEDPLDCKNMIRYDLLNRDQILSKYYQDSKIANPGYTRQQHREFARWWAVRSPLSNPHHVAKKQEEYFGEYNDRVGILSLTANPSSLTMWEKYSESHKGICVGFASKVLFSFLGGGGVVNYCDDLPIIMPTPWETLDAQIAKQVYYKLRKWDFEQEYRTRIFRKESLTVEGRTIALPEEAYEEVIFGSAMTQEHRIEVMKAAKVTMPNVKFKQAILDGDSVKIEPI